ncbi:putative geranyltranstransferase [delta proteobacterium NaphS2]|nr:putative geranyltranstransferase [delta proteobacterium NaphS2]
MVTPMDFDLKVYLEEKRVQVDAALDEYFPKGDGLTTALIKAMRYSLFAGGKRLRPILCIAGAEAVGGVGQRVLPVACAVELIHTYSLIHDDLPVMDDDDLRRGKPTNHKVFGEAIALLAGDGLLTEAFSLMTSPKATENIEPPGLLEVIQIIAVAAGCEGMVGGQVVDILWEGKNAEFETVKFLHTHKTGAMIRASVMSGAIAAGARESVVQHFSSYGHKIGLAFQISDDILDVEGDSEIMGKMAGADEGKGKTTYPSVLGMDESKKIQEALVRDAVQDLEVFGDAAEPLRKIAYYIIERKK